MAVQLLSVVVSWQYNCCLLCYHGSTIAVCCSIMAVELLCVVVSWQYNCCLLWYHDSTVWMVSINMEVQLQLTQMAEDYLNTYGSELAARPKLNTHVYSRQTNN